MSDTDDCPHGGGPMCNCGEQLPPLPPPGDPDKVVIITTTGRRPDDAPLVFVGGHPVPAESVAYDVVPSFEEVRLGPTTFDRAPQRKAVVTIVADPDQVTGEHTRIVARPARPHSTPILGPTGYADADVTHRRSLTLERGPRGVYLAIAGDHEALWVQVDAREVHTLAADLVAMLTRPYDADQS